MAEERRNITIVINGKEVTNTIASINREYKRQLKELNGVQRGTDEYKRKLAELKKTKGILDQHRQDIAGVGSQWDKSAKSSGMFSKMAGGGLKGLATSFIAPLAAGTALVSMFSSGIRTIRDFNVSMDKLQAITKADAQEMAILEATAKKMGATTVFSASESADAMNFMAMAGWNTQQIVAGLPGILDLAAASGGDLATTSDIVTDALTAFGMTAADSTKFADLLASASSSANTNVVMMGETFKYVAPVFGAFGMSAEDAALATGLMANAGVKASQAGTTLRGAFSRMSAGTSQVKDEMAALGLNITDADGNFLPFIDTMGALREKFSELTPEQQASSAAVLFGQEAMSGMLAIVNATEADYNKLTEATRNYDGAAAEMANVMNDNLSGSLKRFGSVIESVVLQFSSADGALKRFVDGASDSIENMSDGTKQFIVVIGGATAVLIPLLLMLPSFVQGFKLMRIAALALNSAILANPFVAAGVALAALGVAASQYISFTDSATAAANKFNKAVNQAEVEVAKQTAQVDRLSKAVLDETVSEEKRLKALEELKKISPDHFKNLTLEKAMMGELATAVDTYRESLLNAAKIRVFTKQLDEAIERQETLKQELADGPSFWDNVFGSVAGSATSFALMTKRVGSEMTETGLLIEKLQDELESLSETADNVTVDIVQPDPLQLTTTGGDISSGSGDNAAQKAAEERKRIADEEAKEKAAKLAAEQEALRQHYAGLSQEHADFLAEKEKLENEYELSQMTEEDREIAALSDKYFAIIEAAIEHNEDTLLLEEALQSELNRIREKYSDIDDQAERQKIQDRADFQSQMTELGLNTAAQLLSNNISNTAKRQQEALEEQRELGLISEDAYQAEREEIQRKAFERQKRLDTLSAIINGAVAITKVVGQTGVLSPFVIPGIIAQTGAQVALIQSQKYEDGGEFNQVLKGPSHRRGGMPVIDPRTGKKRAELEGGEFITRKSAVTPQTLPLLRAINEGSMPRVNFQGYRDWKYEEGGIFDMEGRSVGGRKTTKDAATDPNTILMKEFIQEVRSWQREFRVTLNTTELRDFETQRADVEKIAEIRA